MGPATLNLGGTPVTEPRAQVKKAQSGPQSVDLCRVLNLSSLPTGPFSRST